jgi:hypothetical protein
MVYQDKTLAAARVFRRLQDRTGIRTPLGMLLDRPDACQWCGDIGTKSSSGIPNIRAHHFLPYGQADNDWTVLFVCRPCLKHLSTGGSRPR